MTSTASLSNPLGDERLAACIRIAQEDEEREAENENRGRGNANQRMQDHSQDVVDHSGPPV